MHRPWESQRANQNPRVSALESLLVPTMCYSGAVPWCCAWVYSMWMMTADWAITDTAVDAVWLVGAKPAWAAEVR